MEAKRGSALGFGKKMKRLELAIVPWPGLPFGSLLTNDLMVASYSLGFSVSKEFLNAEQGNARMGKKVCSFCSFLSLCIICRTHAIS